MLIRVLGGLIAFLIVAPLGGIAHLLHHGFLRLAVSMFLLKLWLLIEFGQLMGASVDEIIALKQDYKRVRKANVQ